MGWKRVKTVLNYIELPYLGGMSRMSIHLPMVLIEKKRFFVTSDEADEAKVPP